MGRHLHFNICFCNLRTLNWTHRFVYNVTLHFYVNLINFVYFLFILGPAIPDWAYITQSNIDKFASLFIGRAIGTVTGVLVAGKIVDKFDNMVLLGQV